ncbi:MAG TPA: L,D-transpeptidase [Chloroflexota bacterium]|nr:L,D-transpeptidase [Chloroflexota bacterium]
MVLRALFVVALLVSWVMPVAAEAAPPEYETVGGYFFGEASGQEGTGFNISDADDIGFWTTFRGMGGAGQLGFPISRRFVWNGRPTQVFQRAVLQYEPLEKRVVAVNVLDLLHDRGRDGWLKSVRSVPPQLANADEKGKSWDDIVAAREALLDAQPALRDAYFAASDPIAIYGLPTSAVEDEGSHYAIRLQRGVLQLWKQDVPWASAGDVTVALVGEIARDAGLFDPTGKDPRIKTAFQPEVAPPPRPAPPPPPKPVLPQVTRPDTVPPGIHWVDVNLSRQWVTAMDGDTPVRGIPATTGKPGFSTPTGTFQIFSRVYNETMDSATIGIPRSSPEGYYLKDILYTQYFADGGIALHTNYWQPASVFGSYPTSHACVGMRLQDAAFLWDFATFGTPVYVHY